MQVYPVLLLAQSYWKQGNHIWGCILTVLFGSGILFAAWRFIRKYRRCTVQVKAEVTGIRVHESTDSDGFTSFTSAPEYTYYYEGQQYVRIPSVYSSGEKYQVGDPVLLHIDPEHPEVFTDRKRDVKNIVFICFVMSVFLALGIGLLCTNQSPEH